MKLCQAIAILIENAAANVGGVGQGLRPAVTPSHREMVARAVRRAWRTAYRYDYDDQCRSNLGLPELPEEGAR